MAFQSGESIALQGKTAELAAMAKREAAWHGELQVSGVQNGAGGALLKGFFCGKMWEKSHKMSIDYIGIGGSLVNLSIFFSTSGSEWGIKNLQQKYHCHSAPIMVPPKTFSGNFQSEILWPVISPAKNWNPKFYGTAMFLIDIEPFNGFMVHESSRHGVPWSHPNSCTE